MSLLILFAGASPVAPPVTPPQKFGGSAGEGFSRVEPILELAALEDDEDVALALILSL